MRTLIQGGTVVTATETTLADVVIEDERVAAIGTGMSVTADRVIDATGRYVMPGGVDVHTHMELPFGGSFCSDDFETGTRAAAFGAPRRSSTSLCRTTAKDCDRVSIAGSRRRRTPSPTTASM